MSQFKELGRSSRAELQGSYELRTTVGYPAESSKTSAAPDSNLPPPLPTPTKTRKILLRIGLTASAFDLCILPITFFYSLSYGSSLSNRNGTSRALPGTKDAFSADWALLQVFIVIACLFCMMTFAHYTHRCLRLSLKCSSRYGPIGWKRKWRLVRPDSYILESSNNLQLEFTNVNFAICATIFETVLFIGTWPKNPTIRMCAMVSSIICYYTGIIFLVTAYLTHRQYRLPFNMSSTPKGSPWPPALLAILEDTGAIEARCEVAHREAVMRRYKCSPLFRTMLLRLTWLWGFGLVSIATVTTILIAVLEENIAFGVGWGLPYIWVAIFGIWTVRFVRRSLEEEKRTFTSSYLGSATQGPVV